MTKWFKIIGIIFLKKKICTFNHNINAMRKITFLLFTMFTVLALSQENKFFQSAPEKLNAV